MSNYWRRLPVYLLLDCSESMAGDAFTALKNGVTTLITELQKNPIALETVAISSISFSSTAKQVIPLTDLLKFQLPKLMLGSGTALGAALELWEQCMEREVVKTTAEQKGDYKPICFILTDGEPTDSWENVADRIRTTVVGKKAHAIAVACGPDADTNKLCRITETVILLKHVTPGTFAKFFQWVSASISTVSQKLENVGEKGVDLPILPQECIQISPIEQHQTPVPERFVFLHSKCIKNYAFYLIRYAKVGQRVSLTGISEPVYQAIAAHPVEDFEFEEGMQGKRLQVSTNQLQDFQPCPYCGNKSWAMCSNGHVHCCPDYQGTITLTCPWCKIIDTYTPQSFEVGRGVG